MFLAIVIYCDLYWVSMGFYVFIYLACEALCDFVCGKCYTHKLYLLYLLPESFSNVPHNGLLELPPTYCIVIWGDVLNNAMLLGSLVHRL